MRSSDFLFRLIKSLSKGDRRNFKLFARLQDGDKKYIQLFDAIDKQTEYDERKLLKQFKGERFTKQFSVAKNYLYNYILRTLDIFHNDPHAELSSLIHKIEILMGKNLYDQAEKLVRKAKHMAERQERFGEMLELLQHQRVILLRVEKSKLFSVMIAEIHEQQNAIHRQMLNLLQYVQLFDRTYELRKRAAAARVDSEMQEMEAILSDPLLESEESALSVRAKLKRLEILNEGAFFKHAFEDCVEHAGQMIAIYENHQEIRQERNIHFIEIVCNYGIFQYQLGNTEEAQIALSKLRNAQIFNEQEKVKVFELYYAFKIGLCIESGDKETGIEVVRDFEGQHAKVIGKMLKRVELQIYYMFSYFFLFTGDFSSALIWINKFLNEPKTEVRTDLQCMARILNLLIHLELGNRDLLEYEIKSASRFISNRNRLFKFERTALKFIRQLTVVAPDQDPDEILANFKQQMQVVLEDSFEKKASNLLDVVGWIEAKQKNITLLEVTKK